MPQPSPEPPSPAADLGRRRIIALWLFAIALMVAVMVIVGGLTRLTHSGLSMVEWRPVTGWLPPLTHAQWEAAFAAYRQFPEYQMINHGMSLSEFQGIFWLEYVHRLWGRLIGLAFALPFLFFLVRRWIDRPLGARLAGLFLLGGLQGFLGWYMVASGLVDRPDVSQYRLVIHLGMAFVILGYLVWLGLRLRADTAAPVPSAPAGTVRRLAVAVPALILVTALWGGFVAGLDAGFAYNTFPTMDGEWLPSHLLAMTPWHLNFFEDITTVQFTHRLLATVTAAAVLALWVVLVRSGVARSSPIAVHGLLACIVLQYGLGVATILLYVPVPVAALHQAGAVMTWAMAIWVAFEVWRRGSALAPKAVARGVAGRADAMAA